MPVVSKAQNAAMHAAAEGKSTLGIPKSVGQDFVDASAGMKVGKLPQKVKQKKPASDKAKRLHAQGRISDKQMEKFGG
jgi:hypothetical protein